MHRHEIDIVMSVRKGEEKILSQNVKLKVRSSPEMFYDYGQA